MRLQETSIIFDHSVFRHHYLCHYRPMAAGMDTLSRSLLKFKRGAQPDLDAWIECTREALAEKPPTREYILLRALGHRELIAPDPYPETREQRTRPSSLDRLCRTLALDFGCRYLPTLLSKSRATIGTKHLSRSDRAVELLDVYSAHPGNLSPSTPILLLDDILTTGATIRAILHALRRQSPGCPIRVFTLAKAHYDALPCQITPLHSRNYQFDPQTGWIRPPYHPFVANSV